MTTAAGIMGSANTISAVYFVYDEAGHLIGEYDGTGAVIQETVWLGDLPVGVLKPGALYNVNPDHFGAPLTVTDATGQIVWRWDRDPYGNGKPNENPSGLGTFTYNLRFPGQYYDKETELHYNYFRDYNPKTGRYVQADPIGLTKEGVNLFIYVFSDPVNSIDPSGLVKIKGILDAPVFVHPNDPGPSPSDPHAHIGNPNSKQKIDINSGEIYDGTCPSGEKLSKKKLDQLRSVLKSLNILRSFGPMLMIIAPPDSRPEEPYDPITNPGGII